MKRIVLLVVCLAVCFLTRDVRAQSKVYRNVSNDAVEKVLQSLELKYQKDEGKGKDNAVMFFDFKRGDNQTRVYNYGSDLWIESTFEKSMKRDQINRWNAEAKFSRLVLIETKGKTMLSLECQLDCMGGVTDAMIKQFVNRFDEEAKRFAKFSK